MGIGTTSLDSSESFRLAVDRLRPIDTGLASGEARLLSEN